MEKSSCYFPPHNLKCQAAKCQDDSNGHISACTQKKKKEALPAQTKKKTNTNPVLAYLLLAMCAFSFPVTQPSAAARNGYILVRLMLHYLCANSRRNAAALTRPIR